MKQIILTLIVLALPIAAYSEIEETIKYFSGTERVYYPNAEIDQQFARFEPAAPCFIKKITLTLTGEVGKARIRLLGYESGSQIPELRNDKVPPVTLQKTVKGNQSLVVEFQQPVKFDNSWFWVGVDSLSAGIFLLSDNVAKKVPYDTYFYQAIHTTNMQQEWAVGNFAYEISVLVSYPTKTSPKILQNVTTESGIASGVLNSSIAAADFDADGFIDLYVNNKLYQNNKNGGFTDITATKGVLIKRNHQADSTVAVQNIIDLDNDGDLDFVIFARDTSVAYINNNGNYTEKILSIPELKTFGYLPLLPCWADLNYDGYPDLYLGQQASQYGPNGPDQLPSFVFINNQNNDFTDESYRMFVPIHDFRRARAAQFGDFDNDGDQDLYIANYFLNRDELYQNNGEGSFTDIAGEKELDINSQFGSMHGCGFSWCDYNNDGNLDMMVARIAHARFVMYDHQGSALYRNEGPPDYNFTNLTGQYNDYPGQITPIGLEYEDYHCSAGWADVNNDGLPDLLLKTYNPYRFISFYEQQPDNTFQMKRFEYGLDRIDGYGPGQVWFDYNNDGNIDLCLINKDTIQIYKNSSNNGNSFIELDLKCNSGNKFAIGGRAYVHSGSKKFLREVSIGQDEMNQYPYRLHFGLGDIKTIDSVVVWWPVKPQKRESFKNLEVNKIYTLTEGGGTALSVGRQYASSVLTNAYPNPFSETSVISYSLTENSRVVLKIYDGNGREVRTLVDEVQESGGHQATFNAAGMPQGSYYYRLQIGNTESGKMLILVR